LPKGAIGCIARRIEIAIGSSASQSLRALRRTITLAQVPS
jgi:hypothetical protein